MITDHRLTDEKGFGYVVRLKHKDEPGDRGPYWTDFEIVAVLGVEADGKPLYQRKDALYSPDPVESLDDAETVVVGFVKWDGCTQYTADVHVDDDKDHKRLLDAIAEARRLALKSMPASEES